MGVCPTKRNRVELYFPTKRGNGNIIPAELYEQWLKSAKLVFCDLFGGYTILRGLGGFRSEEHDRIIEEDVYVIYAYCSDSELFSGTDQLRELAGNLKRNLVQECVAIVINNTMEFIS